MSREFRFHKFQGCGNDFIIRDEIDWPVTPDPDRSRLAKQLCDRHFKIGADGVIFIERANGVDGSMRLFEPAGNEADMCGNGVRCVAEYLSAKLKKDAIRVLTRDGVKDMVRVDDGWRVDMGIVRINRRGLSQYITDEGAAEDSMMSIDVSVNGRPVRAALVNTGEPHLVVKTEDLSSENVRGIGEDVNRAKDRFPGGVNINLVEVAGSNEISIRTYERGVFDETMSCGTGATAAASVALLSAWVQPGPVTVRTRGGNLVIELSDEMRAFMTGPASKEFEGCLTVDV